MSNPTTRPSEADGWPPLRTKAELTADIRRQQRTVLVVNIRSRRGRRLYATARRHLDTEGLRLMRAFPVAEPALLSDTLAAAVDLGPDLLVVGGGDGTLSEATNHLAHRDICLGVLPLGTTNNLARSLGIPLRLTAAVRTLARGKVADVDLARVEDRMFGNLASLGVSVQVAGRVRPALKRALGRLAYPLTALPALPRHQPFHARITVGSQQYELHTHQLNIANGSFHAGRPIAADASIDDRLLVVYQLGATRRAHLITATLWHALTGPRQALANEPFLTARELLLDTDPPLPLDIDGEIHGSTPAHIRLEPGALRVMVPHDFPDS